MRKRDFVPMHHGTPVAEHLSRVCVLRPKNRGEIMSLERWIRLIAGSFVTVSVVLSYLHSTYWLFFTLFVGVNLFNPLLPAGA
jgi:Flp pilus assembly protein TadB